MTARINLAGADLSGRNLAYARLDDTRLDGACLDDARLDGALLVGASLVGASLIGASLVGASLAGANLAGANLTSARLGRARLVLANLTGADLTGALLDGANLTGANLTGADLTGARLAGARLAGARLDDAHLDPIRDDVWAVLAAAPREAPAVLAALNAGRVDGPRYRGEYAGLVGTIANARGVDYRELGDLRPDASRPAEVWCFAIRRGDTPETSQIARITARWVREWIETHRDAVGGTPVAARPYGGGAQ